MYLNSVDMDEKIERGKRIKIIRENELHLNKSQLSRKIGISSQFLGLVETGRGNLTYNSLKLLKKLSGHSVDYILFGIDDSIVKETNKILEKYSEKEIKAAINVIKNISIFMKNP